MAKLDWEKANRQEKVGRRNRPGNKIRKRARLDGSRIAAQKKFLADNPDVVCFVCNQRPQPGTLYKFGRRRGWKKPWAIHTRRLCPAQKDEATDK